MEWKGGSGCAWVDAQPALDQMFLPFERMLMQAVGDAGAQRVLDIGCGTGSTTLAAAATGAEAVGIDISEPMIAHARRRAASANSSARFVVDDAQAHEFEAGSFDLVVSRFGVMFFPDFIQAFRNIHDAVRPDGSLCFIAWRGPEENPFMTAAERAAAPLLPDLPPRRAHEPGQFAFADAARTRGLFESGGWRDVRITPADVECAFDADALPLYAARLGPVGQALRDADAATRERVLAAVLDGFAPFVRGGEVRFTAACWRIAARA